MSNIRIITPGDAVAAVWRRIRHAAGRLRLPGWPWRHRHYYLPIAALNGPGKPLWPLGPASPPQTILVLVCYCHRPDQYIYQVIPGRFTLDDLTGPEHPSQVSFTRAQEQAVLPPEPLRPASHCSDGRPCINHCGAGPCSRRCHTCQRLAGAATVPCPGCPDWAFPDVPVRAGRPEYPHQARSPQSGTGTGNCLNCAEQVSRTDEEQPWRLTRDPAAGEDTAECSGHPGAVSHDWNMPHDLANPIGSIDGCPPDCPARLAAERHSGTVWKPDAHP